MSLEVRALDVAELSMQRNANMKNRWVVLGSILMAMLTASSVFGKFKGNAFKSIQQHGDALDIRFEKELVFSDRPFVLTDEFIQIEVPDTFVWPNNQEINFSSHPAIEKALVAQYSPSTVRIRLYLRQCANHRIENDNGTCPQKLISDDVALKVDARRGVLKLAITKSASSSEKSMMVPGKKDTLDSAKYPNGIVMGGLEEDDSPVDNSERAQGQKSDEGGKLANLLEATAEAKQTGNDSDAGFSGDDELNSLLKDLKAGTDQQHSEKSKASGSSDNSLGRIDGSPQTMVMALLTVLCVMGVVGWIVKRFLIKRVPGLKKMQNLKILSTHYIGAKKQLMVVEVAGQCLLLGVSNEQINLISKLDGDGAHRLLGQESNESSSAGRLAQLKAKVAEKKKSMNGLGAVTGERTGFSHIFEQEVNRSTTVSPQKRASSGATKSLVELSEQISDKVNSTLN